MAMFGSARRQMAMPPELAAPDMNNPAFAGLMQPQMQPMQQPMQAMPQRRMSTGRNIAGNIGDALMQLGGMNPMFAQTRQRHEQMQAQMEAQRAQAAQEAAQTADNRAYDASEWTRRQEYQQEHQAPTAPTEMERILVAAGYQPGSPEFMQHMRQYAGNRADPMQTINNGDGTFRLVRPSQLNGGASPAQPPRPEIGATMADPRRAGGQTSPASGTFQR